MVLLVLQHHGVLRSGEGLQLATDDRKDVDLEDCRDVCPTLGISANDAFEMVCNSLIQVGWMKFERREEGGFLHREREVGRRTTEEG